LSSPGQKAAESFEECIKPDTENHKEGRKGEEKKTTAKTGHCALPSGLERKLQRESTGGPRSAKLAYEPLVREEKEEGGLEKEGKRRRGKESMG